jgi:hypothetical protein
MSKSKLKLPSWYQKYIAEAHIESRGLWRFSYVSKAQWLAYNVSRHKITRLRYSNYLRGCRSLEFLKGKLRLASLPTNIFQEISPGIAYEIHQFYLLLPDELELSQLLTKYYEGQLTSLEIKKQVAALKKSTDTSQNKTFR